MPRLFRRSAIGLQGNKYGHPGVLYGVDRLSTGVAGRLLFQRNIGVYVYSRLTIEAPARVFHQGPGQSAQHDRL